jgi:hypothetical protein
VLSAITLVVVHQSRLHKSSVGVVSDGRRRLPRAVRSLFIVPIIVEVPLARTAKMKRFLY